MPCHHGRFRAFLRVAVLVFAGALLAGPPAVAHASTYRHCYWSHHHRYCHSHRAHSHYRRCTWRHPFHRCYPAYRHRPGWNNR